MNLFVWNIPEASTEQEVREFLEHELGHYAKSVTVNEAGTPRAHATVELLSDGPYIGRSYRTRIATQAVARRPAGGERRAVRR